MKHGLVTSMLILLQEANNNLDVPTISASNVYQDDFTQVYQNLNVLLRNQDTANDFQKEFALYFSNPDTEKLAKKLKQMGFMDSWVTHHDNLELKISQTLSDNQKIIVGTIGKMGAGKQLIAEHLIKTYQFTMCKLSNQLRLFAEAYGYQQPFDRETLYEVGKKIEDLYDADLIIQSTFVTNSASNRILIDGIRTLGEAHALLKLKSKARILLLGINTGMIEGEDLRIRFKRAYSRSEEKDPDSLSDVAFQQFCSNDARESIEIEKCMELCSHIIENVENGQSQTRFQIDHILGNYGISQ